MSVKKILLLSAAGAAAVSMTAAMAGGYMHESAPAADNGYYVEGHLGYARQNYHDSQVWWTNTAVETSLHNNSFGGFTGGADVGYNVNRHVALELGWFHLPCVNVNSSTLKAGYLRSWALYLDGKYSLPMPWMHDTDWFFKLGAAYRKAELDTGATLTRAVSKRDSEYLRPTFATGLDYAFNGDVSGVMQYAYFMGSAQSFPLSAAKSGAYGTVPANVFTLGLAYHFNV